MHGEKREHSNWTARCTTCTGKQRLRYRVCTQLQPMPAAVQGLLPTWCVVSRPSARPSVTPNSAPCRLMEASPSSLCRSSGYRFMCTPSRYLRACKQPLLSCASSQHVEAAGCSGGRSRTSDNAQHAPPPPTQRVPPGRLPSKGAHVPNNLVDSGALESVAGALCSHQMCSTVSGGATARTSSRMSSSCCTGLSSKATDSTGRESEVVTCLSACCAAAHASAPEQRLRKAMAATGAISSKSSITSRPALVDRSRFAISGKQ